MRYIISQINALWEISAIKNPTPDQVQADPSTPFEEETHTWRPWEHIYAISKVQKGPHVPPFNPYGKYAVRLYWMVCMLTVSRTNPGFLLVCRTSLLKTLWEKEKLILTSSFSFTHSVFYPDNFLLFSSNL